MRVFGEFQVKFPSFDRPFHVVATLSIAYGAPHMESACTICIYFSISCLRLGENNLDMEAVQVIADVLKESENIVYLG